MNVHQTMQAANETKVLFFLLMAAALTLSLAATEVRGTVRDIYDRPLEGVRVRVSDAALTVATDRAGSFVFTVDDSLSVLTVLFESPQFHGEKRKLLLRDGPARLHVTLVPLRLIKEEVTVTALNDAAKPDAAPAAQSVVSAADIQQNQPESIVQALQNTPGVHFIGKGGVSVTPSIRGLARRRILLLVDGARIVSDRSAGASAQFLPPEMIGRVEVVRSAASVLYGSDAIGGVIQVIPTAAGDIGAGVATLNLSGHSADERINGGFSLRGQAGDLSLRGAVQVARAGDYAAASGTVLHSGYNYAAARIAVDYETAARGLRFSFLKSAGRDIGKPERANDPDLASIYPEENAHLLTLSYRESGLVASGSLNVSLFLNASDYELNKTRFSRRQVDVSRNRAVDFGLRFFLKKEISPRLSYQAGLDYFGRAGVDMENETWKNGALSDSVSPLARGRRGDMGIYGTLAWSGSSRLDLLAGARLGAYSRSALAGGVLRETSSLAPAFFLGVTRKLGQALALFVNAATAFRMPSLSEAFYTGITGRSFIVGNPDLGPERSAHLDAGITVHGRGIFAAAYLFQYSIRGLIEKFPLSEAAYTYDNIERGRIRGWELEFQCFPLERLEIFGNGSVYQGRNLAGGALNDVPGARLFLGAKLWLGRIWGEVNWLKAAAVRRPGPAEVAVPAYDVTDLKAGGYFSNRLFLFVKVANLFNRPYYANADPDIPLARGLDLSLGLNLNL